MVHFSAKVQAFGSLMHTYLDSSDVAASRERHAPVMYAFKASSADEVDADSFKHIDDGRSLHLQAGPRFAPVSGYQRRGRS